MNEKNKSLILCTFSRKENLKSTKNFIFAKFNPKSIIVYRDKDYSQFMLFYDVDATVDFKTGVNGTIMVHHKTSSNTYFTINALNLLVKEELGTVVPNHEIKWDDYINKFILSSTNTEENAELNKLNLIFYDKYYNYYKDSAK